MNNKILYKKEKYPISAKWLLNFKKFKEYVALYKKYPVQGDNPKISNWVSAQRTRHKYNNLGTSRVELLNQWGFIWENNDINTWDTNCLILKKYIETNGIYPRPVNKPRLAAWVSQQRRRKEKNKLSQYEIDKLNEINFVWISIVTRKWEKKLQKLQEHIDKYNSYPNINTNERLSDWVLRLRAKEQKGELSAIKIKKLNEFGFVWSSFKQNEWEEVCLLLKKYLENHKYYPTQRKNQKLFSWVATQRKKKLHGKLSPLRIEKLNKIGFKWTAVKQIDLLWDNTYHELIAHLKTHDAYPDVNTNKALRGWVYTQRVHKNDKKLSDSRIRKLNKIGFIWASKASNPHWERVFLAYKKHLQIHKSFPTSTFNKPLYRWAYGQRIKMRNGELTLLQIKKLNSIGYVWDLSK